MSKKITHEQARLLLREDMSSFGVYTLRTYIKQQEELEQHQKHSFVNELSGILYDLKQTEKLLELYKEALETNFEGITLIKLVNKTAHEKLIELGYEYISHSQGHRYKHKEEQDVIDIDLVRSSFYHFRYISAKKVEPYGTNLELSKILTQYLEELENE